VGWRRISLLSPALLLAYGCSDRDDAPSAASVTPVEVVSATGLPGEDVIDAVNRLFTDCMDEFEVPYEEVLGEGSTGSSIGRAYDTTYSGYAAAFDECKGRASALIPRLSDADLAASYQLELKFLACLDAAGFDTGDPVSQEEWIATGGLVDPSSNWQVLANSNDPAFNTAYTTCFTSVSAEG